LEIINGYVLLDDEKRTIFYSKDVVFPKIPEQITLLPNHEEDPTIEDFYIIDDYNEDDNDSEYVDEPVYDDSTEANTISTQSYSTESNNDNGFLDRSGTRLSTRRLAMTSQEIRNVIDSEESDYIDEEAFVTTEQAFRTHKQDTNIPKNFKHLLAMKHQNLSEYKHYIDAMHKEMANMYEQHVFKSTEIYDQLPLDQNRLKPRYIDSTWVFAKQYDEQGNLLKYKARLCGRGFREIQGLDYDEVYSPTVKQKLVRAIVTIAASQKWQIYQDDCKAAYLNAPLEKGKWLKINLPTGDEKYVFIKKCLYGLKESARQWYKMVTKYLIELGFQANPADPCTYFKLNSTGNLEIVLALFVDDILSTGEENAILKFRKEFKTRFRVSEKGGICKHFLSMKFSNDEKNYYIDQTTYISQKLQDYSKFLGHMAQGASSPLVPTFQDELLKAQQSDEYETTFPYREMVGSLVYAANGTRFDITAAVSIVSRFANKPKKIHCDMVRKIYHYLRANPKRLKFTKGGDIKLVGYCDSSLGNLEDYSSLAGYCFMLGDTIISWKSFKEPVIALSTAEAEYIALTPAVQECIYLQQFLTGLGFITTKTEIHEDNNACIALAKNPQDKKRTRHIQIRFHWIRQQLDNGVFTLVPTKTHQQLADLFTKGLYGPQLRQMTTSLGLITDSVKQGENEYVDASQNRRRSISEITLINDDDDDISQR
jgi:hypothetical protein